MTVSTWAWSDRLSLAFDEMDATHKEFVELCAALSVNNNLTFIDRLDALIEHSVRHFEQENAWMRDHDFPPAQCHIKEHNTVLEIMQEVRKRFIAGDQELGARLAEELPHWFENHVDSMDAMLANFMSKLSQETIKTV